MIIIRIIVDGTVGAGKTTVLRGTSQRDPLHRVFPSFSKLGFPVFGDLIIRVIDEMRKMGISDPSEDWPLFFKMATALGISFFENAKPDTINFYDRGIYFLEIMAKRYGQTMPSEYYSFCDSNRYDTPVFVFEPLLNLDMTHPHDEDNRQKVYTKEDRIRQHSAVIDLYHDHGYNQLVLIPVYSDSVTESVNMRIKRMMEVLGI